MIRAKGSILSTSSFTKVYQYFKIKLKEKEAVKYITFILFILLCIISRYIVITKDKNSVGNIEQVSLEIKH